MQSDLSSNDHIRTSDDTCHPMTARCRLDSRCVPSRLLYRHDRLCEETFFLAVAESRLTGESIALQDCAFGCGYNALNVEVERFEIVEQRDLFERNL